MAETSTIGEHITNLTRHRKQHHHTQQSHRHSASSSSSRTDLSSSIMCKSSISSLLISPFTTTENTHMRNSSSGTKKTISLRGLGCTAPPEVTVPGVRPSWGGDQERESNAAADRKKKKKKSSSSNKKKGKQVMMMMDNVANSNVNDLWCGPGFGYGYGYDGTVASVDCVNPHAAGATSSSSTSRPLSHHHRGKIDLNKAHHRERASYSSRQRVNTDNFGTLDLDSAFELPSYGLNILEDRFYNHLRNRTPDGLAEIMMFHNDLLMGRRSGPDRYRDWRLDVDNMTYEELLELGERIGYVNTGLEEEQILRCIRKTKLSVVDELSSKSNNRFELEGKCSICQDEYEAEDEMGKLKCGHSFHLHCIKYWLSKKNACPVCKAEASSR